MKELLLPSGRVLVEVEAVSARALRVYFRAGKGPVWLPHSPESDT